MSASKDPVSNAKLPPRAYGKIVLTLENVLLDKKLDEITPSQLDGLDQEAETDLRILGCELIQTAGYLLKLPQVAMATGQTIFQRFFYSKSFVRHSMESTAMSAICLASKIEEAPRRIRDVINVFHHIKQVRAQKQLTPMILDQTYINLKSQVIKAERRVLKELGFCVHVKHPHKLIVMYLKYLDLETHQQMMQTAWNYMNDSFRTDVFVRYQPETIACACIYLTARKLNIVLPRLQPNWFDIFKVNEEDIIDVCYRISALYRRSKPNLEQLEEAVEKLKHKYQELRKSRPGINTPPLATTTVDRNNGSHNAWGGFISRAVPVINNSAAISDSNTGTKNGESKNDTIDTEKDYTSKKRSRSRSKSQRSREHSRSKSKSISRSHTPNDGKYSGGRKKNRHRSRTPKSLGKKRTRNYSRSSSSSSSHGKNKKSDKRYDRRQSPIHDRERYSNGSGKYRSGNGYREDNRTTRDRDYKDYRSKYIKSYHQHSTNRQRGERDRSRDRRR